MNDLEFIEEFNSPFKKLLENYYPFNYDELKKEASRLTWGSFEEFEGYEVGLSNNKNIKWNQFLIDEFSNEVCWEGLCLNEGIFWTMQFAERNAANIKIKCIVENKKFPWSNEPLRRLMFDIAGKPLFQYLCGCEFIRWDGHLIREHLDKINWETLSMNPNVHLTFAEVVEWKHLIVWRKFVHNKNVEWDKILATKWIDKHIFHSYIHYVYPVGVDSWDWGLDTNPHTAFYFQNGTELNNFKGLSANQGIDWSKEFILGNANKIDWKVLCYNQSVDWDEELIDACVKHIRWDELSGNHGIKWKETSILKYCNNLNLGTTQKYDETHGITFTIKGIDTNPNVMWTENLIQTFAKKWNWNFLLNNNGINWTKEVIEKNIDHVTKAVIPTNENLWSKVFLPIASKYDLTTLLNLTKPIVTEWDE